VSAFANVTGKEMFGLAFLNPYLLWGLAGAAIPILIHLFNRRRFRTVAWGAMEFLLSSSKMTARRLKILQALLLLTRMGIIGLLVLGVARPFLTEGFFGGALARSKSSAVIVLDNSYSMGLREGNKTNFDIAKKVAGKIVSGLERGDSVAYILMASRPRVITEGNPSPERVNKLIENSELCDERTDILSAVVKGLEILDSEKNTRKELFLITDCQKNGWGVGNRTGWEKVNPAEGGAAAKVRPRIYVVDVSRGVGENITVSSVELPAYPCGAGKKYAVEVSAKSWAEKPVGRPIFTLFLDDGKKASGQAEGSEFKDGVSRARFVFSVKEAGCHWGKIEVGPDCLEADNARYFSVEARESVRILCVDGAWSPARGPRPGEDRFESGIAYLAYAFAPEKGVGGQGAQEVSNILDPRVVAVEQFWEEDLRGYDIVVLSNARGISGRMYDELAEFVGNGGGLMIFLGDRVDPAEYLERYGASSNSFLPCAIGSAKGELPEEGGQSTYRIAKVNSGSGAMAPFRDGTGGDLSTAKFYRLFSVEADTADPNVSVLATFEDGSPYLVEKKFGRGKTILFTSSCDLKWSNIVLKPAFVPLVHRLVYDLVSGAHEKYALRVGEKIVERGERMRASGWATITDPAGKTSKVFASGSREEEEDAESRSALAGDGALVSFEETSRAGVYTLETGADSSEGKGEGTDAEVRYFSVNVDTEESDLSALEEKAIERLMRSKEFRYLKVDGGAVEKIERIREGKEIWRLLMVGVICLLVVESVVARRIDMG